MTRGETRVLRVIATGHSGMIAKSYFDSFPGDRPIAKRLLWEGFLEACGTSLDSLRLTPMGKDALKQEG